MRISKRISLAILLTGFCTLIPLATFATAPTGTLFPVGAKNLGVTAGPDGNLWFVKNSEVPNKISKMTLDGTVTDYPLPDSINQSILDMSLGPDGNMWFAEGNTDKIGKITAGGVITEYIVPDTTGTTAAITAGPDGNVWFLQSGANYAGKVNPTDGTITPYTLSYGSDQFGRITSGLDGNLWLTDVTSGKIIKLSTSGASEAFALPNPSAVPFSIINGPDGNLWFTEVTGNKIGKITPQGNITEYDAPASAQPFGITVGPDQNIWVSESNKMSLLKITTDGSMEEFDFSGLSPNPFFISTLTVGPDGELWASDSDGTNSLIQFTGIDHIAPNTDNNGGGTDSNNSNSSPNAPKTGVGLVALMLVMTALCAAGYEVARSLSKRNTISKRSVK